MALTYQEFLQRKTCLSHGSGFSCEQDEIHPWFKPFTKDIVQWAVKGGRRAIFSSFGLHKTVTQLETVRLVLKKSNGGVGLIVAPLGVRQEFFRDAEKIGTPIKFVRRTEEIILDGIYLTNHEIAQYTMPGETVYDPFAGLGTVPLRAVGLGRVGIGCELAPNYWLDATWHLRVAAQKMASPMLFDVEEALEEIPEKVG